MNEDMRDDGEPSEHYGGRWIECKDCGACTNIRFGEADAPLREQWNLRANSRDLQRLNELTLALCADHKLGRDKYMREMRSILRAFGDIQEGGG
jgi:hypothetical protein